MKRRYKFVVLCACWMASIVQGHGQVSGHEGKRVLLRFDPITTIISNGFNIGTEYAAFRKISFTGEVFKAKYEKLEYKALREETIFKFGSRIYMNKVFCAPKGRFFYTKVGLGSASFQGQIPLDNGTDEDYKIEPRKVTQLEFGFGIQSIVFRRVIFAYHGGVSIARVSFTDEEERKVQEDVRRIGVNQFTTPGDFNLGYKGYPRNFDALLSKLPSFNFGVDLGVLLF